MTFDASFGAKAPNGTSGPTYSNLSWSHTLTATSNTVLMVAVSFEDGGSTFQSPTSVSFGSESLTKIATDPGDSTSLNQVTLWYLVNPIATAATITVGGLTLNTVTNNVMGTSMSFANAAGIGEVKTLAATATNTAPTLTFTGVTDGSAIFGAANFSSAAAVPSSLNLTLPGTLNSGSEGAQFSGGQSSHGAGYLLNPNTTLQAVSFSPTNNRNPFAAAVILPIPEPSAAMLGGLGVLALLRRRRA